MKELKPGDRVRVWGWTSLAEHSSGAIAKVVGRVEGLGNTYELRWVAESRSFAAHRKQLRKLVRKERRRVEVSLRPHTGEVMGVRHRRHDGSLATVGAFYNDNETVEFVEVRRKK